jgi:hypothetical protein
VEEGKLTTVVDHYLPKILRPALKDGGAVRLLARQRVYAWTCDTHAQRSAERFAQLFRGTWGRLPLWARRRILGHWYNDADAHYYHVYLSPKIEVGPDLDRSLQNLEGKW